MKYYYLIVLLCFNTLCYAEASTAIMENEKPVLTSPAFDHGTSIPMEYTCDGQNLSPPLAMSGIGKRAQSLMLVVVDKESSTPPYQSIIWFVYNLPPHTKTLLPNQTSMLPTGRNSHGNYAYQSPCPKDGTQHHYYFNLYALDRTLPETVTSLEEASDLLKDHLVGYASLMGTYARK